MTEELYRFLSEPFRQHSKLLKVLKLLNSGITGICYAGYPLLLLLVLLRYPVLHLIRAILVPGVSFVALSIFRAKYNAPRPYEVLSIDPLIHKSTRGKSFPSRHVFSVFIIAMTWLFFYPPVGILLLIAGVILALVRILAGIHFPSDVLAGAVIGILCGIVGFRLIPL